MLYKEGNIDVMITKVEGLFVINVNILQTCESILLTELNRIYT